MTVQQQDIEKLAYTLWEEQGRPEGQHTAHWLEAERRLHTDVPNKTKATLPADTEKAPLQDTPGKAKSSSSRQQTASGQQTQTGSSKLDGHAKH